MSLKNAAFLALIGMIVLTLLVAVHFIDTVTGIMHNLIPTMALVPATVYLFASLCVLVFFFVFYRAQS